MRRIMIMIRQDSVAGKILVAITRLREGATVAVVGGEVWRPELGRNNDHEN